MQKSVDTYDDICIYKHVETDVLSKTTSVSYTIGLVIFDPITDQIKHIDKVHFASIADCKAFIDLILS